LRIHDVAGTHEHVDLVFEVPVEVDVNLVVDKRLNQVLVIFQVQVLLCVKELKRLSLQELLDCRALGTLLALGRLAYAGDEANFDVTEQV